MIHTISSSSLPSISTSKLATNLKEKKKLKTQHLVSEGCCRLSSNLWIRILTMINLNHLNYLQDLCQIGCVNRYFNCLTKKPSVINPLLTTSLSSFFRLKQAVKLFPYSFELQDQRLKIAKFAGSSLTYLNLSESTISPPQLQGIFQSCPNIQRLNLSYCRNLKENFFSKLPQGLRSFIRKMPPSEVITNRRAASLPRNLRSLEVTTIHSNAIQRLPRCLQFLGCRIQEGNIEKIALQLPRTLTHLRLAAPLLHLTKKAIQYLPEQLKVLELLAKLINDVSLKHFLRNLYYLDLGHCTNLEHIAIHELPPNLQVFRLNWQRLTDKTINNFPKQLQFLDLSNCENLSDLGIKNLSRLAQDLEILDLSGCKKLTISGISYLQSLKNLTFLSLRGCKNLTDETITYLPHSLRSLDISQCYLLTNTALKHLSKKLRNLDISYTHLNAMDLLPESLLNLIAIRTAIPDIMISKLPKNLKTFDCTLSRVNSSGMIALHGHKNLRSFHLRNTYKLAESVLDHLPQQIKFVDLREGEHLPLRSIKKLIERKVYVIV